MLHTISDIAELIATKLNINKNIIVSLIPINLLEQVISNDQREKIDKLINSDDLINNFGINNNLDKKFNELKFSLGKLQMLALIKKLKTATKSDEVVNTFVDLIKNKLRQVNKVLNNNIQFGGNKQYYKKYIKYKEKYLLKKNYI